MFRKEASKKFVRVLSITVYRVNFACRFLRREDVIQRSMKILHEQTRRYSRDLSLSLSLSEHFYFAHNFWVENEKNNSRLLLIGKVFWRDSLSGSWQNLREREQLEERPEEAVQAFVGDLKLFFSKIHSPIVVLIWMSGRATVARKQSSWRYLLEMVQHRPEI